MMTLPDRPVLSIWLDAPRPSMDAVPTYAAGLAELFDLVSISLNAGTGDLHRPTWRREVLLALTLELQRLGVCTEWMVYPEGTPRKLELLTDELRTLYGAGAASGVEPPRLDLDSEEKNRRLQRASVRPFMRHLQAFSPLGVRVNCVPMPSGQLHAADRYLIEDEATTHVTLQSASLYKPGDDWTHHDAFRPAGSYMRTCLRVADQLAQERPGLRVGLYQALHSQGHPAPHPSGRAAMETSGRLLVDSGRDVGCWATSSLGEDDRAYLRDWLRPRMLAGRV